MREPVSRVDAVRIGLFYVYCALVLLFLIAPIVVIIPLSFNIDAFITYPVRSLSLRWYDEFFTGPRWLLGLYHSVGIGIIVTLASTVLGTAAALGLDRVGSAARNIAGAFFLLPVLVPAVVIGSSLYLLLAPLGLTSTFTGIVLGHTVLAVPFVVIIVTATLGGVDRNFLRAAASLGASPPTAFRRITLPLILPGIVSGAVFAFSASFDEIILTRMLAGPAQRTLPLQMFDGIREHITPTITAAATILVVISVLCLTLAEVLRRRIERLRTTWKDRKT